MPTSAPPSNTSSRRPRRAAEPVRPYHHGKLKEALTEAALDLAAEAGEEGVTMREAARRAGVSPGAPFRHFPDRKSLLAAAAEEALRRFRGELDIALAAARTGGPLERLKALGLGYLRWALRNPAHFQILSTRAIFDLDGAETLREDNAAIIAMMEATIAEAARSGQLRDGEVRLFVIAGRALVYGFARMFIDGHFPRWKIESEEAERLAEALIDLFITGISAKPAA
jgi:AcrR family transcriptional regulator